MSLAQVQPAAMIPGHGLTAAVAHLYLSLGTGNVGVIKGETIHLWENSSVVVTAAYAFFFFPLWQASKRLWTCLCGNSLYFFNNAKDAHVRLRHSDKHQFISSPNVRH